MTAVGIEQIAVVLIGGLFAVAGIINLGGNVYIRAVYRLWHYRRGLHRFIGILQLLTALFIFVPQLRIWGVILSGLITFFTIVSLLNHRQYVWSLPAMLVLMALIPVSLT